MRDLGTTRTAWQRPTLTDALRCVQPGVLFAAQQQRAQYAAAAQDLRAMDLLVKKEVRGTPLMPHRLKIAT